MPTKICTVKAMVFPVIMYGCESCTIKKAERQRINAFQLWCWRFSWTARRSNQSILKEIRLEYSLEGLMLKLKFQYFSHLIRRTDLLKKTLMLGNIEGGGEGEQQEKGTTQDEMSGWHLQINGHEFEQAPGVGDGQRSLVCCSPCGRKESDTTEWLNEDDTSPRKVFQKTAWCTNKLF